MILYFETNNPPANKPIKVAARPMTFTILAIWIFEKPISNKNGVVIFPAKASPNLYIAINSNIHVQDCLFVKSKKGLKNWDLNFTSTFETKTS